MNSSLTTIDELSSLIDNDKSDHKLKVITQLFLRAALDWPTSNQKLISEFAEELKQYFGTPLTKKKISQKAFDSSRHNAWRHEAGSSIIEMLDLSETFYNHSDFDEALNEILTYYEKH